MIDAMSTSELRLWCLRSMLQHPDLIDSTDGTLFISGKCGCEIFNAIRFVHDAEIGLNPFNVGNAIVKNGISPCLIGVVDVFVGFEIKRFMAERYVKALELRSEEVANGTI